MHAEDGDETLATFPGARTGEELRLSAAGVSLIADGRAAWHAPYDAIRSVLAVRRISENLVHDAVHVCAHDGRERHLLVATSLVDNDYDVEFSEAAADAIADAVCRAAGLEP